MKLFTSTVGDGAKQAVLIHGLMGDGGTWFELAPWIAEHGYTVTLVDLRGHGQSPRAERYRTADFSDDLVETLPHGLNLICGLSLGGRVLTGAVERLAPRRAVYLEPGWIIPEDLVIARPLRADGSLVSADELGELVPDFSRAHLENFLRSNAVFDPTVLDFPLATILPPEGAPAVESLVVAADPSTQVPPDLQERLRADGYTVQVIAGGQHDLHITDLTELQGVLEDWL